MYLKKEGIKMHYSYKTKGTCSQRIDFDINDNIITNVTFFGGCDGNTKAISALTDGLTVDEIVNKCGGISCGFKNTSCGDQLAQAVKEAYAQSDK